MQFKTKTLGLLICLFFSLITVCTIMIHLNITNDNFSTIVTNSGTQVTSAYVNGEDLTIAYTDAELLAKNAVKKRFEGQEVEFIRICHLGSIENMTLEIIVQGEAYTLSFIDHKLSP